MGYGSGNVAGKEKLHGGVKELVLEVLQGCCYGWCCQKRVLNGRVMSVERGDGGIGET